MAARQGFALHKSRRRDPRALGFGKYVLVNLDGNFVRRDGGVVRADDVDRQIPEMSIDDVERYLTGDKDDERQPGE
jgi:hypothetical protein